MRDNNFFEGVESFGVAEKTRHVDQEIAEQPRRLLMVTLQEVNVALQSIAMIDLHAAMNASNERPLFVAAEIVPHLSPKDREEHFNRLGVGMIAYRCAIARERIDQSNALPVLRQLCSHVLNGHGKVDETARDGAVRHAAETWLGAIARLRKDKAALLLDRFDTENAVAAASREHDADGIFAAILGERTEKHVDGTALWMFGLDLPESKRPTVYRQGGVRRENGDAVRLNLLAIARDMDGQAGVPRENVREEALSIRREMGDDDKSHAEIGWNRFEELLQGL